MVLLKEKSDQYSRSLALCHEANIKIIVQQIFVFVSRQHRLPYLAMR